MSEYIKPILMVCIIGALFYPGITFQWNAAHDPYIVGRDAQQYIPAFDVYGHGKAAPDDYIKRYYRDALMLPGYKAVLELIAEYGDTRSFSRQAPYVLYIASVILLSIIAGTIGGYLAAASVAVLALSSFVYFGFIYESASSRMFGAAFLVTALWTLVANRPYVLALITIIASLFYPLVASVCGVTLASWLLLLPRKFRGEKVVNWSLRKRVLITAATGLFCIVVILPTMVEAVKYGPRITEIELERYPEAGVDGVYKGNISTDSMPYGLFDPKVIAKYLALAIFSEGSSFVPVLSVKDGKEIKSIFLLILTLTAIGVVILIGVGKLVRNGNEQVARLSIPFIAGIGLHIVSWLFAPYFYIPGRYLLFTVPLTVFLLFPIGAGGLLGRVKYGNIFGALMVAAVLVAWGGRADGHFQLRVVVDPEDRSFYEQVAKLPVDSLIAGWPTAHIYRSRRQISLDRIPFLSRRNVLMSHVVHQALHTGYTLEMRRRMDAVFAAYFATDAAPLTRLRDDFGVTHFLVDVSHFAGNRPEYFAPWDEKIDATLAAAGDNAFLANPELHARAGVFYHGSYVLLDLSQIEPYGWVDR